MEKKEKKSPKQNQSVLFIDFSFLILLKVS